MGSTFQEKATLILRTEDLTNNSTTNVGTCDFWNCNFTWNNINMKLLLGDMYDKYDDFNINLSQMSVGLAAAAGYGTDAGDRIVNINMSGLSFKNQGYSVLTKSLTQTCSFMQYLFNNSTTVGLASPQNVDSFSFTFSKDELVNINLFYTRAFKNTAGNYGIVQYVVPATLVSNLFPQAIFTFKITGIPRETPPKSHLNFSK